MIPRYRAMRETCFAPGPRGPNPTGPGSRALRSRSFAGCQKFAFYPENSGSEGVPGVSLRISTYSIALPRESDNAVRENLWGSGVNRTCRRRRCDRVLGERRSSSGLAPLRSARRLIRTLPHRIRKVCSRPNKLLPRSTARCPVQGYRVIPDLR